VGVPTAHPSTALTAHPKHIQSDATRRIRPFLRNDLYVSWARWL